MRKVFTVSIIHNLLRRVQDGEITYSKMVEIMNDRANQYNPFFDFNYKLPEQGREITYLLGNGIDGTNCALTMVIGYYDESFGDFERDENGIFKYVTCWSYLH